MYDRRDTNGTELRAFAGNFLLLDRRQRVRQPLTLGHFDLPLRGCTIQVDNLTVVRDGALQSEFA